LTKKIIETVPAIKSEELIDTDAWANLRKEACSCVKCPLSQTRKNVVFGNGSLQAQLMFVGEGPGADEDAQGLAFVGKAGQLLTKMIQAMKLTREEVYIANVVKCRPPGNRNPEPLEIQECFPYLKKQVELVQPLVIVALGTFAAQSLLKTQSRITVLRGRFHESEDWKQKDGKSILLMPTFHPAFLLRNPESKKEVWEDLRQVMQHLGLN
jgi:DNA polymerase